MTIALSKVAVDHQTVCSQRRRDTAKNRPIRNKLQSNQMMIMMLKLVILLNPAVCNLALLQLVNCAYHRQNSLSDNINCPISLIFTDLLLKEDP
ncbi:hypothetical protein T03_7223 [Trichinella britovi]|uniref:Uncharacterized protein n=1 Tax=Trichinella britovi TaxID=45882 RepID=A0A0V1D857_TRIBR|nr:hypothetical protein T03_7223 [Trichinella britovi]